MGNSRSKSFDLCISYRKEIKSSPAICKIYKRLKKDREFKVVLAKAPKSHKNSKSDLSKKNRKKICASGVVVFMINRFYLESEALKAELDLVNQLNKRKLFVILEDIKSYNNLLDLENLPVFNAYERTETWNDTLHKQLVSHIKDLLNANEETVANDKVDVAKREDSNRQVQKEKLTMHYKCRYDPDDDRCKDELFTRTKHIKRYPVKEEEVSWDFVKTDYNPVNFTSDKIKDASDRASYKDPKENDPNFKNIKFNEDDKEVNYNRKSYHGNYKIQYNDVLNADVPLNPIGRTGIIGRGHLGRWGPNHAADPIVTRWKRDENGNIEKDGVSGKPILQFIGIQRRDTKEWAIPGGMVDSGEGIQKTLKREFAEEALSIENVSGTEKEYIDEILNQFFKIGLTIYEGYVDDPRNTDNSWMETLAQNFHDEDSKFVGRFNLKSGSDACSVKWIDLSSSLKLFASHTDFLAIVAKHHDAHW